SWPLCVKKRPVCSGRMHPSLSLLPSARALHMAHPDVLPASPAPQLLEITQAHVWSGGVVVSAVTVAPLAGCPTCGQHSARVHSRYQRTLADLPCSGLAVQFQLQVRRFFCEAASCPRKTFAERLPEVAAPYARQTARLRTVLQALG